MRFKICLICGILILVSSCVSVRTFLFRDLNYSDTLVHSDSLLQITLETRGNVLYDTIDTQKVALLPVDLNIKNIYSETIWIDDIVYKGNLFTDIDLGRFYLFNNGMDRNRLSGKHIKIEKGEIYHYEFNLPIYKSYKGNIRLDYSGYIYNKRKKIINDQKKKSDSLYVNIKF